MKTVFCLEQQLSLSSNETCGTGRSKELTCSSILGQPVSVCFSFCNATIIDQHSISHHEREGTNANDKTLEPR